MESKNDSILSSAEAALVCRNLPLNIAEKILYQNNIQYRIISKDGKQTPQTCDYSYRRLNLTIMSGIIIDLYIG